MRKINRVFEKKLFFTCIIFLVQIGFFAAGEGRSEAGTMERPKISIMAHVYEQPMNEDSPLLAALEEYTGADVELIQVPHTVYEEKFNITLASGNIPNIILAQKMWPSVISACRAGAFWEIGPYLKNYPNLSQAHPVALNNTSIDGKTYCIYRRRDLGRLGMVYRKDWLKNIGMTKVETIDDFYNMLYGFTYKDPDGDGKDDTFGMICPQYKGPWLIILTWFGAPNDYAVKDGQIIPAHYTDEYLNCMKFWKKLYDENLINQDFAVYDNGKWDDPVIAEQAGVKVDVLDTAGRWENKFKNAGITAEIGLQGAIKDPDGELRTRATTGYNGVFLISRTSVKTEAELDTVLTFMDKCSDLEMQDLLGWGIKDRHYVLTADGEIDPDPKVEKNQALKDEISGSNQLLTYIPPIFTRRKRTPIRKLQDELILENEKYVVGNPALPLLPSSEVYGEKGAQLDQMIDDARIRFIAGQIDEAGWRASIEEWKKNGGEELLAELSELYAKGQ